MAFERLKEAMRDGSVSAKASQKLLGPFANKVARDTVAQPSKMAKFHNTRRDEGKNPAAIDHSKLINDPKMQQTSARIPGVRHWDLPSRKAGIGSGPVPPKARSHAQKGGGNVEAHQQPTRAHIDGFPGKQGDKFPSGTGYAGRGPASVSATNTRMKGKDPIKSGGPDGHNPRTPRYYGGPKGRDGT